MARHGVALAAARADTVQRLDAAARLGVGPFPRAALAMAGEVDGWLATMAALDAEDRLRGAWPPAACATPRPAPHPAGRIAAISRCATSISTCRRPRARPASRRPSWCRSCWRMRGWWRCRAAGAPLLLLDEIAAHLDAERRAALFDELVALGVQSWMTGTDAELFAPLGGRAQILRVADGSIAAV